MDAETNLCRWWRSPRAGLPDRVEATTPDVYPLTVNVPCRGQPEDRARAEAVADVGTVHHALRAPNAGLAKQVFSSRGALRTSRRCFSLPPQVALLGLLLSCAQTA